MLWLGRHLCHNFRFVFSFNGQAFVCLWRLQACLLTYTVVCWGVSLLLGFWFCSEQLETFNEYSMKNCSLPVFFLCGYKMYVPSFFLVTLPTAYHCPFTLLVGECAVGSLIRGVRWLLYVGEVREGQPFDSGMPDRWNHVTYAPV